MSTNFNFADPDLTPTSFGDFSKQEIAADSAEKTLTQLEPVPAPRNTNPMDLAGIIGTAAAGAIQKAGQIVFHTVGDTGGIHNPQFQFAVADAMSNDVSSGAAFWYHLGDVVYYFGQEQYYFEQFYDPYRDYNGPIFAIAGNHDGALYTDDPAKTLAAFLSNFCTEQPTHSPDSQGAYRTTMTQPGVYFTLNAPFVKFIGLYSNTGEGGTQGVIAGKKVGNAQIDFLKNQLTAAKNERDNGQWRALVIATHHPPFTGSPFKLPSPDMLKEIDQVCESAGIYPDLHLSGHAHLYERYTRTVKGKQIPYIVAGMGGYYNLPGLKPGKPAPVPKFPASGTDASGNPLRIEIYNDKQFGFVRLTVSPASLSGVFVTVDPQSGKTGVGDTFTVNLKTNQVSKGTAASKKSPAPKKTSTKKVAKKTAKPTPPRKGR